MEDGSCAPHGCCVQFAMPLFPITMSLVVTHNETARRFIGILEGIPEQAVLEYRVWPNAIEFIHTFVPEPMRGQRVADTLAQHALRWGVSQARRLIPLCPFVAAYVRRHVEFQALVPARFLDEANATAHLLDGSRSVSVPDEEKTS